MVPLFFTAVVTDATFAEAAFAAVGAAEPAPPAPDGCNVPMSKFCAGTFRNRLRFGAGAVLGRSTHQASATGVSPFPAMGRAMFAMRRVVPKGAVVNGKSLSPTKNTCMLAGVGPRPVLNTLGCTQ